MTDEVVVNQGRSRCLYEEVFGRGNYAAADDLMAADTVNHGPGSPPVLGTDGIKRQAALLRWAKARNLRSTSAQKLASVSRCASSGSSPG